MKTTFDLEIVDAYNLQLGNAFHEVIKKYVNIADALNFDREEKNDLSLNTDWGYVEAKQKKYYGLVEALWNSNLIKKNMNICDLGCGFGTTLFNIAFQFRHYKNALQDKNIFNNIYTGIEIDKDYIDRFKYVKTMWDKYDLTLNMVNEDIMTHDCKDYDLITSYSPIKNNEKLYEMYKHIFSSLKKGCIFIEHYGNGLGKSEMLLEICKESLLSKVTLLFGGKKQTIFIKN